MSFKETDFTGTIGFLKSLLANQKDPILFRAMVEKLVNIYDQLPVYPGLVNMCIGQAQKAVEPKDLKRGQKVFVTTDTGYVSGIVAKTGNYLHLKNTLVVTEEKNTELDFGEIKQVASINDNVVEDLWPSLVFDKEQK